MDGETIDFLAECANVKEEVSHITKKAMEGKIDFFEALTSRVWLLKGLPMQEVKRVCQNLPYMNGADKLIHHLKSKGIKVVVFSGGFHTATLYAKDILGYDGEFANTLHVRDDKLSGKVGGEMMFSSSKGEMLKRLRAVLGIKKEEILSVGDGANDISMFQESGVKIAFCAKETLKHHADFSVDTKDLTKILDYIRI